MNIQLLVNFLIFLLFMFITGCDNEYVQRNELGQYEYLVLMSSDNLPAEYDGCYVYTHKGNCRFCQARLEEMIRKYHLEKEVE